MRLRGKPHKSYQPATGTRCTADADGFLDVHPDHVKSMLRMGAEPVEN